MNKKLEYFYNIGPFQSDKILKRLLELKLVHPNKVNNDGYSLVEIRDILKRKEIFEELSEATKTDLIYNPLRVIPREFIDLINNEFNNIIGNTIRFNLAGSYIRGKKTSGDIDMVINLKDKSWNYFANKINENSKIIKLYNPYAQGSDKVSTIIEIKTKANVKMDVFLSNDEDYIFAMLFATGSGKFNIRMRYIAKKKGYLLNHHGLYQKFGENLKKLNIKTELEIFDILNIDYKLPADRNI